MFSSWSSAQKRVAVVAGSLLAVGVGVAAYLKFWRQAKRREEKAAGIIKKGFFDDVKPEKERPVSKSAKQRDPDEDVRGCRERGNEAFRSGRYLEAEKHYTDALTLYNQKEQTASSAGHNASLYVNRALTRLRLERIDDALMDAVCAARLDETNCKAFFAQSTCLLKLNLLRQAKEACELGIGVATLAVQEATTKEAKRSAENTLRDLSERKKEVETRLTEATDESIRQAEDEVRAIRQRRVDACRQAAEQQRSIDPHAAYRTLNEALQLLDLEPHLLTVVAMEVGVLHEIAEVFDSGGKHQFAHAALEKAAERARADDDAELVARVHRHAAELHERHDEWTAARQQYQFALLNLNGATSDASLRASLHRSLARVCGKLGDTAEAERQRAEADAAAGTAAAAAGTTTSSTGTAAPTPAAGTERRADTTADAVAEKDTVVAAPSADAATGSTGGHSSAAVTLPPAPAAANATGAAASVADAAGSHDDAATATAAAMGYVCDGDVCRLVPIVSPLAESAQANQNSSSTAPRLDGK